MQYNRTNLELVTGTWNWQARAACRGMGVDVFFDADSSRGSAKHAQVAHAKAVCATCPVTKQCLDQALALGEAAGVWEG